MDINDIIIILYLIIPMISFMFGLMESTEKQKGYGRSNDGSIRNGKTVGVLLLPPALVQLVPILLLDIFESYIWKCIVYILAICTLIFTIPRNFLAGLDSSKEVIPESIKKYEFMCLKMFFILMAVYIAFKLVISKWFELL